MSKKAIFVTFEGMEGVGKSTQVQATSQYFSQRGFDVLSTREPGGSKLGNGIRDLLLKLNSEPITPLAEVFLLEAARAQHVLLVLQEALQTHDLILCDRFADATLAYQGGGRGLDAAWLAALNQVATNGLTPDRSILLDTIPKDALARAQSRDDQRPVEDREDRFETEALSFHGRVRQAYLDLAKNEPNRFLVLDASLPKEKLTQAIVADIEPLLSLEK